MSNYVTFAEESVGLTEGKLYLVQEGWFLDDYGDVRWVDGVRTHCPVAIEGNIQYVIRCTESPNPRCKGKFINSEPDYSTGYIRCSKGHPAGVYHFTLDEVAEFLRFTHKQYHEKGYSSKFEVLLAPLRVVAEPPKPKRGNGGHEVGTLLRCVVSGHQQIVVGQTYRVDRIDSDGDEWIEPVNTHEHTQRQNKMFPARASNPGFARKTVFDVVN